jgi:predicted Zn-dependent protease
MAGIFVFGPDISSSYSDMFFNPCKTPIVYSIGNVDSGFGVSSDYLLSVVKEAEQSWESNYKSNLFEYLEGKGMKINLIYDYRQDSTQEINNLDNILGVDEDLYNELKKEYDNYVVQYNSINSKLDQLVSAYNQSGYKKKNAASDLSQIRLYESQRNDLVDKINNLQQQINNLAAKYNVTVKNYNNLTESIDSEFEQGNYVFDAQNKEINIYQFDNKETLVAVLIHEMGHALGLGHSEDPADIMYSVNAGESQDITEEDLNNINNICSKTWWDKVQERLNTIKK